jgi:RNA polymerase sigma factor (sigma-70 family)
MKDEQLIWDDFRFGDEASFKIIFETYHIPLFNYGHKFTADDHLIQDAMQNLFVKLWKNRSRIRETGSVKNYLYKSFRRVLLRMMDMKHRKYEFSALIEDSEWSSRLEPDQTIVSRERVDAIRASLALALEKMSPRQREIIHLRYYEEMEYDEIAVIMQLSVSSTYKLVYKAIDTLRNHLAAKDLFLLTILLNLKRI